MIKFFTSVSLILIFSLKGFSQSSEVYNFDELNNIMEDAGSYDKAIEKTIDSLQKRMHLVSPNDLLTQYELSNQLYEYYKVFKYDSAYEYAVKCQKIAYKINDPERIAHSSIILNFTLLSSGLFKESADSLQSFALGNVSDKIKAEYYSLRARYYYDLADYARDNYYAPLYNKAGGVCLDSALKLFPIPSFSYSYYTGLKDIRLGNMLQAKANFQSMLKKGGLTDHELALVASTLSDIYIQKGSIDSAIALLIDAAIADIKSSTKETSAMYNLAQLLYKKGDIKNASKFIEYAIKDAAFYGARQRKVQLIAILPLIEAEKISQVESQKKILIGYSFVMTILLIAVIFLAYTVYKQVAKLKQAQKIISEASQKEHEINQQLAETNNKLSELNNKLSEANKIKEEYIGYFFNANSEFFNRIERFKRSVEQKLVDRKIDEIKFLVNNINLRKEKEDLLKNFDKAFLRLFPHFVKEFNTLFKPEDRIQLKDDEILNTDLRIFALIRMGIHDIGKIAQILEYSVNTINTYKTKIKNKSIVPNEEFEVKIMQIETITTI
ncbi:DUF6377 domain-containing protein [Ferruginibacter sp. SUN002]|uniref:DUF6377 domain-containing protein n=1 Tax=Ferruginibacter sp. SUN002 TaxID=2937789 RepID=UPI003D367BAD